MLHRLTELTALFLKLGSICFGGPAVAIAAMQAEAVERRGWLTREQFLDLLGATYLIPGPNAIQMAGHIGYRRAGVLGSVLAAAAFTLPAVLISGGLAWCYVRFGKLPQVEPVLYLVKPVVLGLIGLAVVHLGKKACASWPRAAVGAAVAAFSLAGGDALLTMLLAGLLGAVFLGCVQRGKKPGTPLAAGMLAAGAALGKGSAAKAAGPLAAAALTGATAGAGASTATLWTLAVFFLKVGALLYGGGYVLIAYLQHGLVGEYGLVGEHGQLNEQVLLDAVAVGQITPGPLLSTVTFIGYWLLGWPGACVATVAVLLPSLVFVTAASPWIPRLRRLWWTGLVLDAVSAAAVGLTLAVALRLGWAVLVDWASCLLTAATIAVGLWWTSRPRRPTSPPTESLHAATQNVRGSQR